jgi:hypothetical protein
MAKDDKICAMTSRGCGSIATVMGASSAPGAAGGARGVNLLSSVINAPSTSETTAGMLVDGNRGGLMTIFQRLEH